MRVLSPSEVKNTFQKDLVKTFIKCDSSTHEVPFLKEMLKIAESFSDKFYALFWSTFLDIFAHSSFFEDLCSFFRIGLIMNQHKNKASPSMIMTE